MKKLKINFIISLVLIGITTLILMNSAYSGKKSDGLNPVVDDSKTTGKKQKHTDIDDPIDGINGVGQTESAMSDICRTLPKPGWCKSNDKIGLITYDKNAFATDRPGDNDCYIIKEHLKKNGYCIEGMALESPESLSTILNSNTQLKNRYSYVGNVGHGMPGHLVMKDSKCQLYCRDKCSQQSTTYNIKLNNTCYIECWASEESKSNCPCWKETAAVAFKNDAGMYTMPLPPPSDTRRRTKSHNEAEEALESATSDVNKKLNSAVKAVNHPGSQSANCVEPQTSDATKAEYFQCLKNNSIFYGHVLDLELYAQLLKPYATMYAVSCNTGETPEQAKIFAQTFCSTAPTGTMFNVALVPTQAADVNPNGADGKTYVKASTSGNFVCYKCVSDSVYEGMDCSSFDFPANVDPKGQKTGSSTGEKITPPEGTKAPGPGPSTAP